MKFVDEYRDAKAAGAFARAIAKVTTRPWTLMEICGGQTHAIVKFGVDELLPRQITLVHGPGCPVCVTPVELIDKAIEIAARREVIFCSFGDMLRVPGTEKDLFVVKAEGGDVRVVYSPLDCLKIARDNPQRQVVFFAVGFETTAKKYRAPIVVTGFEPLDILQGVYLCVRQLEEGRAEVENQYARSVRREGNHEAQRIIQQVFRIVPRKWRGIGEIPRSGLGLSEQYAEFDAETKFGVADYTAEEPSECVSGLIMQGVKKPHECSAFGVRCTPENPLGAPMVSNEGACAAYYRYRRSPPPGEAMAKEV